MRNLKQFQRLLQHFAYVIMCTRYCFLRFIALEYLYGVNAENNTIAIWEKIIFSIIFQTVIKYDRIKSSDIFSAR